VALISEVVRMYETERYRIQEKRERGDKAGDCPGRGILSPRERIRLFRHPTNAITATDAPMAVASTEGGSESQPVAIEAKTPP
jgi:hypothetical protein